MDPYFPHRPYPMPRDEASRMEMVRHFQFLADPALESKYRSGLDQLCEVARQLLHVDRAFVSMVFDHEQHFVARANLDEKGTPREIAFCAHAIAQEEPLVVPDARLDSRFAANPLVTGPFGLQFYAGTPLTYEGQPVGTFCVVDGRPRELTSEQKERLAGLSKLVIEHLRTLVELNELREQSVLLRQTERIAEVGGWIIDVDERSVRWSNELYALHELSPAVPVTYEMLRQFYPHGEAERLSEAIRRSVESGDSFELEIAYRTLSGAMKYAKVLGEVEARPGTSGRVLGTFRDLTEQRTIEAQREKAQLFDSLTGLANRARLETRLSEILLAGAAGVLVMLGLDAFTALNDANGRADGDLVLRTVATALLNALPSDAIIARVGGDEFAVALQGTLTGLDILHHVTTMRAAVDAALAEQPRRLLCTASMGVTVFPADAAAVDEILQAAEFALRNAKASGAKRIDYFAPELRSRIEKKIILLDDVRRGVAAGEFLVHYQPICGSSGIARGFEALMRWQHPERGLLTPYHFMLAFDDPELSLALGDVALEQALAQIRAWTDANLLCGYVAVNLSSSQLGQPDFPSKVEALLAKHEVSPHRLMLEITESVYLDGDRQHLTKALERLRTLGVQFALDDFGTGYASLSHLRQFAVDRIKVDQSFVQDIGKSADSAAIVRAIVSLGLALGLQVVAEGVETEAQLSFMTEVGCELIQGYYFARPMPAHEAATFCRVMPQDTDSSGPSGAA